MRDVILFMFAGRRENLEINLPLIAHVLDEHPNVRCQIWNLAREHLDNEYLRSISDPRFEVINTFYGPRVWQSFDKVWRYYTSRKFRDYLFVKIDDDVVFFETETFSEFLDAIEQNPGSVVSAETINNGASTPLKSAIWDGFMKLCIPLLDVHLSNKYAEMAHEYMFTHWRELIAQPMKLVETDDWMSINLVGMDWATLCRVAERLGRPSPGYIAGRHWRPRSRIGDEGSCNMEKRYILQGFLAGHLGFGPQHVTDEQLRLWRHQYTGIGREYLCPQRSRTSVMPSFAPEKS